MAEIAVFEHREALAAAAAALLARALAGSGARSLAVAGGSTPGPIYDRLSRADVDWRGVSVTLTDDRFVDRNSPLSNERLVRERLLAGAAAAARLLPLKGTGAAPEDDALALEPRIAALQPFSAVLLGMGEDGHVASLFPGATLPPAGRRCVGVEAAGLAPFVPRITLTAAALLDSRQVVLAATGAAKRERIESVLADPDSRLPLAAILRQDRTPVRVLWAP